MFLYSITFISFSKCLITSLTCLTWHNMSRASMKGPFSMFIHWRFQIFTWHSNNVACWTIIGLQTSHNVVSTRKLRLKVSKDSRSEAQTQHWSSNKKNSFCQEGDFKGASAVGVIMCSSHLCSTHTYGLNNLDIVASVIWERWWWVVTQLKLQKAPSKSYGWCHIHNVFPQTVWPSV